MIPQAKELADQMGLTYQFHWADLGDVHPNSVRLQLQGATGSIDMQGASIGGGRIKIDRLDGFDISCDGSYITLIARHKDEPGLIAEITRALGEMKINIAFLEVSRRQRGSDALLVAQTDDPIDGDVLAKVGSIAGVRQARLLPKF